MKINGALTDANQAYLDSIKNDQENKKLLKNQEMGQDAFLKLLMAQMENQDPLDPMNNKDTIAQMAQFSTVEQLQGLNKGIEGTNKKLDNMAKNFTESIAKLNNNLVSSEEANIEELNAINELQSDILEELIQLNKANKANKAYDTETTTPVAGDESDD